MGDRKIARVAAVALATSGMCACAPTHNAHDVAKIQALQAQVTQLQLQVNSSQTKIAQLESRASAGDWILWYEKTTASGLGLASGLMPQGAYSTKAACLNAARSWSVPGAKIVAIDPYILVKGGYRWTYRCLPRGAMSTQGAN